MDYLIEGMHCGACAARIERHLAKLEGAGAVTVNYATRKARVSGDLPPETVAAVVAKLGYGAKPFTEEPAADTPASGELRSLLVSAVLTAPVFVLGMAHIDFPGNGLIQGVLTTAVLVGPGRGFFVRAATLLRSGGVNMDTLVAVGVGAAYGISVAMLLVGVHHYYFETAAVIVTMVLLGRYLEDRARRGTQAAVKGLAGMQVRTARRLDGSGREEDVPIADVAVGDRLIVKPGDKVPTDGVVDGGESSVDESMITGESLPVLRRGGESVFGASTNVGQGRLIVRVTKTGKATALAHIVSLVEEAQASKAAAQRLADQVAAFFVPAVLLVAVVAFLAHALWLDADWQTALIAAVSVLVVACPCALGLATPTAILAGTGRAAERLILIRSAPGLEKTGRVTTLVMDKTGTLTEGHPAVSEAVYADAVDPSRVLAAALTLETASRHPLAMAVVGFAEAQGVERAPLLTSNEHVGEGLEGEVELVGGTVKVAIGSPEFLARLGAPAPATWLAESGEGRGRVFIAVDGRAAARLTVEDKLRTSAPAAVKALTALGVRLIMATGDRRAVADRVARELALPDVRAELKPEGKVKLIRELQAAGERVAMVGDGINDAPALAAADVGIAVGSGADVALDAAQVVIPHGDLAKVVEAIYISKRTMRVIWQNLGWAFAYNVLAIPVAAAGKLSPMVAAAAMALSSVSVVANSLRLRHLKS